MDQVVPRRRRVFVLGRDAILDVGPVARDVIAQNGELVLLSLGHPVAESQERVVGEALRLAAELPLCLDAVLVTSLRQLQELISDEDQVVVLADGRERKLIERTLAQTANPGLGPTRDEKREAPHATLLKLGGSLRARPHGRVLARALAATAGESSSRMGAERKISRLDASPKGGTGPAGDESESESVEALSGRDVAQPTLDTVWTKDDAHAKKNASLRVYLGAAPGVGKTYAMLGEGQRRRARGTDVVVGVAHTYGRPKTTEMLEGLEVIPPSSLVYRGTTFDEMDAQAVIDRRPEVALVDELAHTNIPGSRRAKRWEDVLDILEHGIAVITTVNVQHLASLNDVVARITGIRQQETVPDWVLDLADQVELVDMSPHALQRRMVHGNVYPDPRKSDLALRRFFTMDNLTALRELALMRVANQVDEELLQRWSRTETPETRERILVCVSRKEISEDLIRRGGRIAQRTQGDLLVVHVVTGDQGPDPGWQADVERLVEDLGGEFRILQAEDPVEAVLSFAYQQHVTQILVGESMRSRWQELVRGSFVNRLIQRSSNVDVHVIARRER